MTCKDCLNGNIYCEREEDHFRTCKEVENRCMYFHDKNKYIYKSLKVGDKVYKLLCV